jgi:hypothetical protein
VGLLYRELMDVVNTPCVLQVGKLFLTKSTRLIYYETTFFHFNLIK